MKTYLIAFILLSLQACQPDKIEPTDLVGIWHPTYETRTKDANGNYGEWQTIYTFVPLPSLSFTSDGQLLYWQGEKEVKECCQFTRYSLSGKNITLSDLTPCPTVKCDICPDWKIIRLEKEVLELELCNNVQERYFRTSYPEK